MKIAIIVVVAIVLAGGAGFVIMNNKDDNSTGANDASNQTAQQGENSANTPENQTNNDSSGNPDPNNYTQGANIGGTVDVTDQKEVTISIDDNIFETTYLKIKKGTKVTWVNNGNIQHDVTSESNSPTDGLGSELLSNGESYEFIFDEAGLYEYFCTPHPTEMRGVITVVE